MVFSASAFSRYYPLGNGARYKWDTYKKSRPPFRPFHKVRPHASVTRVPVGSIRPITNIDSSHKLFRFTHVAITTSSRKFYNIYDFFMSLAAY
jgi:hypothetical protein